MSTRHDLPYAVTHMVRDTCLCLHVQRAARAVARRFDDVLRPVELTNGQFSLLMSLNRAEAASIGQVSTLLAMDRTTLTANLKPLERRGLVKVAVDPADKRSRRLTLTAAGRALLIEALPLWKREHAAVERRLARSHADHLRADLRALSLIQVDHQLPSTTLP
jgi:DNA-binding MarR family transcriptional regulator